MKKRLLSLALALVMVCGLLPTAAMAVTVTEIVPCKYDEIRDFSEGLAAVRVGDYLTGKWGFIDKTGKEVVPCKYENDSAPEFHDGLAAVRVDTGERGNKGLPIYNWGFIDKTGKEVVSCQYRDVQNFSEGLAAVEGDSGEKDRWDNTIYKWGFIDATGKEVVPCKYDDVDYNGFSEGFAAVKLDGKWGFIDKTGKEVIPCTLEYNYVKYFSEGLALVGLWRNDGSNGSKWGFIDKTGKEVVPCKYDEVKNFSDGLAAVVMGVNWDKKWGFIDTTGKEVVPCQYSSYDAPEFHNGLAVVEGSTGEIKNGKTVYAPGVIDAQGNVVVPCGKYDEIEQFSDGLAAVNIGCNEYGSGGKWGFIDKTGKEVVSCQYRDVQNFSEGLAAVELNDRWGFIDTTGKEVVPCTLEYWDVGNISDGLAAVWGDSGEKDQWGAAIYKWGFIDKTGAEVVPCKYDPVENFSEGLAGVRTSNGWGCIDLHGNEVIPCQYGKVRQLSAGLVAVQLDGKWGVLRVEGLPTEPKPGQIKDTSQTKEDNKTQEDKKTQEAIITERREETAQERREKAIQKQQNNPQYQEYLKANREFLEQHIEERDYIYTIVTDDIQNCSDEICAGLTTNAEKVLAIHNWVTENIYYDYPLLKGNRPWPTAQTVFDKKSYVCSGYTILFQALCWAQKIPCVAVAGPTRNGYHAWNAVQVDGEWSWVDATWDTFNKYYGGDQWIKGDQRMDYYRCSSEFLATDHKATNSSSKSTWSNGEWVTTEYIWCYTTNGVNANLPDQSKEETQQIIEQSNKLLEEEKPLEERLAELAMENPTLSGWAKDEVVAAIKANLVPADLMDGYNTNITRQEFCSLMVMMLEQATGKKALDYIAEKGLTYQSPFTDTNLPTVGYAYTLGIVKGTGDTTFNPNGSITRQEAATMLGRAGRLLGLEAKSGTDFADRQDFPSWAVEGIAYVSGLTDPVSQKKVMEGTGGGFTPKGTYTREQGIITALRLFRCGD